MEKQPTTHLARFLFAFLVALAVFTVGLYVRSTSFTAYSGMLPCADCAGTQTTLLLYDNNTYRMDSTYIDRGGTYREKGTWQQIEKNKMQEYILQSGKIKTSFQILTTGELQILDMKGNPMKTPFPMTLKKQG